MAIPGSQGGHIYNGATAIYVSQHTTNWMGRGTEVTVSNNGFAMFAPTIIEASWSAEFPLDDPNFPEVIGLVPNTVAANPFYFKHGNSTKADKLVDTYIESVQKVKSATGDVVRVSVSGKGGTLTVNVVAGTG